MDSVTPEIRSQIMRLVKSMHTSPELLVRKLVWSLGGRYRLHAAKLPGKPDLSFPKLRKVIFVHGCFWHRHSCKKGRSTPADNRDYWLAKFERNRVRDRKNLRALKKLGWRVMIVWECQTRAKRLAKLVERIKKFLEA